MQDAREYVEAFLTIMKDISSRGLSPLVVYQNKTKKI
jgi:hypothetical protein